VLLEKRRRYIEAITAIIWVNISSAKSNCRYLVRVLAIRGIVEAIVNFCVGGEGGEEVIEVSLIGTVSGVVSTVVWTETIKEVRRLRYCVGSEQENGREEEK
jgi:hypothetical protein